MGGPPARRGGPRTPRSPRRREPAGDPALLCYTSGTTGAPKGAVLAHGNLLASAEALRLAWRWAPGDRLVLALPLFHIHGLGVGLHGTLLAGASAVLLGRFEVDAVLDAARDHRATLFFGVPTMYARLAASPRAGELGRLRLCVSGSAPLPPRCSSAWPNGPASGCWSTTA
jgi:malonyl-CoA/methylmalonyl-CoA synthetase